MNEETSRSAPAARSALGGFDFLKGLTMLMIVVYHTAELFTFVPGSLIARIQYFCDNTFSAGVNAAFFIIGGYSLRKRPVKKMLVSQWNNLKWPYILTGLARTGLLVVVNYLFFHGALGAMAEGVRSLGGFLLALNTSIPIGGFLVYHAGPMWFLISMAAGLCYLNAVLNYVPEKWVTPVIIGIFLLYEALTPVETIYAFCLFLGLYACCCCYIGYLLKQKKLFQGGKRLTKQGLLLSAILFAAYFLLTPTGIEDRFLEKLGVYSFAYFDLLYTLWGVALCLLFVNVSSEKSKLVEGICILGRYSMYIFCAHTVELMAFPWYLEVEKFRDQPVLGFVIQLTLRFLLIAIFSLLIHFGTHLPDSVQEKLRLKRQ